MLRIVSLSVILVCSLLLQSLSSWTEGVSAQEASATADCPVTTPEENIDIVDRYARTVWDQANVEALDDFLAEDYVRHGLADDIDWAGWPAAFPDLTTTLGDFVAEGDLVAGRWVGRGTHDGKFRGIEPTGAVVEWTGLSIYRIECGRIAEIWNQQDYVSLLRQMGVTIGPEQSASAATPAAPTATAGAASPTTDCATTTPAENKEIIQRWYEEVWNQGNYDLIYDLVAESHFSDRSLEMTAGPEAREAQIRRWRSVFPDWTSTLEDILADENMVVTRWTATGTHQGELYGVPATGETRELRGISFFEIECGKIATEWTQADALSFFDQFGFPVGPSTAETE
jgi:steroid delta-isomerase-like uncharacterized protein